MVCFFLYFSVFAVPEIEGLPSFLRQFPRHRYFMVCNLQALFSMR